MAELPLKKIVKPLAVVPLLVSVRVSGFVVPLAVSSAPFALTELAQTLPAAPAFAHGHGLEGPSPEQSEVQSHTSRHAAKCQAEISFAVVNTPPAYIVPV